MSSIHICTLSCSNYVSRFYCVVSPLFVIEFLHRVVDNFEDYFGECNESTIKEHYVVIFEVGGVNIYMSNVIMRKLIQFFVLVLIILQLLDEMLDNGFPLATESNILKELIKPPTILRTIANTMTGKSK